MDTSRPPRVLLAASVVVLALSGCVAEPDAAPTASGTPAPSGTATASEGPATPSPTPSPYALPPVVDGERARTEFESVGDGGVPTGRLISQSAVLPGEPLRVEGECIGDEVDYRVTAATPEAPVLITGTLDCADGADQSLTTIQYSGVVQIAFVDTTGITRGWARLVGG